MGGQRPGRSLPPGKTRYPLYRRLGGTQGQSGQVRKISPPPGFEPLTVQPVASRYTGCVTRPFIFRLSEEKIQVSLKSDKNNGRVTWRRRHICVNISLNYSWTEKCFKIVQKIKAHILLSVTFFFENRAVYEMTWKVIAEAGRPQMTM